jgi:DNA polymerase III subunit delta'
MGATCSIQSNGSPSMLFEPNRYQAQAWKLLSRSFESGKVAGTYLFYGPEGAGQWPLALAFASLLNCTDSHSDAVSGTVIPCGKCLSCRAIVNFNSPHLLFAVPLKPKTERKEGKQDDIEAVNEVLALQKEEPFRLHTHDKQLSIPIELARDIQRRLSLKGERGATRVALFFEMEKMRGDAADSLLKLIEEPPSNTVIILTSANEHALPITIRSRSQEIRLRRIPTAIIEEYLHGHCGLTEERAAVVARTSGGSLGRALANTESGEDEGFDRNIGFRLFKSLVSDSNAETTSHLVDMISDKDRGQADELLSLWQTLIRDCAGFSATGDADHIVNVDFQQDIVRFAPQFSEPLVAVGCAESIKNTLADLRRNVHIHGALVALSLSMKGHLTQRSTGR